MNIEGLKKLRATSKGSMTRLLTFVRGNMDKVSLDEASVKHERAMQLLSEFQAIERDMFNLDSTVESDLSEFEDNYYLVVAGLNSTIRKRSLIDQNGSQMDSIMNTSHRHSIEVRLPKINIPIFDGNYMEWQSFFDIYTSTIHERENLTGAQKFQYLKGVLKGEPATLIRHLSVTDASYNEALQKLIQRYDRKRHAVNAFIKSYMEQQNILQPNASNIRKFADTLDESIRGLKALGPEAERRDPWLIYVALNKLDNESRSLWARETADNESPT